MVRKASDDIFESGVDSADDPLVEVMHKCSLLGTSALYPNILF